MTTGWSGPALLVPITLEALVLTSASYDAAWSAGIPNYGNLKFFLPPGPPPLNQAPPQIGESEFTGVVLHWALPDGLTRGTQGADGSVTYPPIPNRWLVTRRARTAAAPATWAYDAWVVASDAAAAASGSPFPNPTGDGGVMIGRSWTLAQWPGEAGIGPTLDPPLTAAGPGDPTFTAYAPALRNVLCFTDPLDGIDDGPLTYAVQGWYADPAQDPLSGTSMYGEPGWQTEDEWQALMQSLGWSPGDDADLAQGVASAQAWAAAHSEPPPSNPRQTYPARTLCHGVVFEVWWRGPDGPYTTGVPTENPEAAGYVRPQVAIGHRSLDALAVLLAEAETSLAEQPSLVAILEAFQANALELLDLPDADAQLAVRMQQGWFGQSSGGTAWEVVPPPDQDEPSGSPAAPDLTSEQQDLLTALGIAQRGMDATAATLAAQQWQRYALWWKENALRHLIPPPPDVGRLEKLIADAEATCEAEIQALLCQLEALRVQRDAALVPLRLSLGPLVLKAVARPQFLAPNDPVIAVTGAHRSYKHGEDGRFSDDGMLFCRFTGQTVSALTLQVAGAPVTVPPAIAGVTPYSQPDLPAEIADLVVEAFFLDTTSAPVIATAASDSDPWSLLAAIRQEQTLIWNASTSAPLDQQTIAELSGLQTMYGQGALPSKVGVQLWSPPWTPLFLDWEVCYYPAAAAPAGGELSLWELPASTAGTQPLDEFAYDWAGPEPPDQTSGTPLQGRTLLTPQATDVLAAQVEQLLDVYGADPAAQQDLWALQDALEYVENADLLTQALGGFNLAMLQRDPSTFRTPHDGTLAPFLDPGGGPSFAPDSAPEPAAPALQFNPIRAGHVQLMKLWVVDAFGQVFDVLGATDAPASDFRPQLATDLDAGAPAPTLARLKPRLTQPARLSFPLLSADDDALEVGVDAGADPVCGWLMLNQLDESLLVYDAGGDLLGELLLTEGGALWLPPPDAGPPPTGVSPVTIDNRHLQGVVGGIVGNGDSAGALRTLLDLVDEVSWAVDPSGGWADQELPALVGRPLAVVRAALRLELQGPPAYSQAWADTGKQLTGGFDSVLFPVELGATELLDDGLVGFYLNDDYSAIQSSYTLPDGGPYLGSERPALACGQADTALLTLVMAPQSAVHAITGLLPPVSMTLPSQFSTPALSQMEITFRTGPVIGAPASVSMPTPALRDGAWSWLQYPGTKVAAQASPVFPADAVARLPDTPPVVREGWLKLTLGGPPTDFTYSVAPVSVAAGSTSTIEVTVYNGAGRDVDCSEIVVTLPPELSGDVSTVVPTIVPDGTPWTITGDGTGTFTAAPATPATGIGAGATIGLSFAGVRVDDAAGTATIALAEVTDALRDGAVQITKIGATP